MLYEVFAKAGRAAGYEEDTGHGGSILGAWDVCMWYVIVEAVVFSNVCASWVLYLYRLRRSDERVYPRHDAGIRALSVISEGGVG